MTSQELVVSFYAQLIASQGHAPVANPSTKMAILFGTDEFRIDWPKRCVVLPLMGELQEIAFEGERQLSDEVFDWAAITARDDEFDVVFGRGNPFVPDSLLGLPMKDGVVMAVPSAVRSPLDRKARRRLSRHR